MSIYKRLIITTLFLTLLLGSNWATTIAQTGDAAETVAVTSAGRIVINRIDVQSAPTIGLQLYGYDSHGLPLTLTNQNLVVRQDDVVVPNLEVGKTQMGGTFTLFLLDTTEGVAAQLPQLQSALEQYASADYMMEQVDSVAIYQAGEQAASELLAPTGFYNSVRNLFAQPLRPHEGATALLDNTLALLNNANEIAPKKGVMVSLVIVSDGTDDVSDATFDEVGKRAAELGIPIHTIWLDNALFSDLGKNFGKDNLNRLATETGGLPILLDEADGISQLWSRITSFRPHAMIWYTVDGLMGGTHAVQVSVLDNPAVMATGVVTLAPTAPTIVLNIPAEARDFQLASLDTPIEVGLTTTTRWLDDESRAIASAQLIVNGAVVQEIAPKNLTSFTASIGNFIFGENNIQIAIVDEGNSRALSAPITLTIFQGESTDLPVALQPPAGFSAFLGWAGSVMPMVILIVVILIAIFLFLMFYPKFSHRLPKVNINDTADIKQRFSQWTTKFRQSPPPASEPVSTAKPFTPPTPSAEMEVAYQNTPPTNPPAAYGRPITEQNTAEYHPLKAQAGGGHAYLEVLESVTRMVPQIEIQGAEIKMGRSPSQVDIAFENDITVSRVHALLVWRDGGYSLFDQGSSSGTWVNEQQIPATGIPLRHGDEIRLGVVRCRFLSGS